MHVAQFNISRERNPLDHPDMADFVRRLDVVNAAADGWAGFVWRLHDESGNATAIRAFEDKTIIFNLSVWRSVPELKEFVYRSSHYDVLKRRLEWFHRIVEPSYVLWLVDDDHRPSVDEAKQRLAHLREHGPSDHAFTFDSVPGGSVP
ncbi:DUF3291 domain-containing protein [Actinocrispum wychmicini]|uniref:Uncharacterized protein DUF3291 n=1 Tax=Actinocrispum wychmicini TaxID=1213861 RepID=A0A4R2JL29_9PSEU|nr:DUF3291 domain-containing protein [Actinocrispum wychmicini]TCO59557.1 uncharacterized protein DUF3291 [Actinocrispum wychmicini]